MVRALLRSVELGDVHQLGIQAVWYGLDILHVLYSLGAKSQEEPSL